VGQNFRARLATTFHSAGVIPELQYVCWSLGKSSVLTRTFYDLLRGVKPHELYQTSSFHCHHEAKAVFFRAAHRSSPAQLQTLAQLVYERQDLL